MFRLVVLPCFNCVGLTVSMYILYVRTCTVYIHNVCIQCSPRIVSAYLRTDSVHACVPRKLVCVHVRIV